MKNHKKIGLFGFGTVGQGFTEALKKHPHLPVDIEKICVKRLDLPRINHELYFTDNPSEILDDSDIDIVIELIDDANAAKQFVESALINKKHVISANKKMIGESLDQVALWHTEHSTSFLYEAAVGGGIPIVHSVDGFLKNQEITKIRGILNGSSNYILTQMQQNKWTYEKALNDAQKKGFAESNPVLDVSGMDASNKLSILAYHAFGEVTSMKSCELKSIEEVTETDIKKAKHQGKKIKPIATIEKINGGIHCSVKPEKVGPQDYLFSVDFENNAISIDTLTSGQHIAIGKGAGALPTGSAVLEDLKRVLSGHRYAVKEAKKVLA
ncbi:homoserine dehydrogenase [Ekhidna sp.]